MMFDTQIEIVREECNPETGKLGMARYRLYVKLFTFDDRALPGMTTEWKRIGFDL